MVIRRFVVCTLSTWVVACGGPAAPSKTPAATETVEQPPAATAPAEPDPPAPTSQRAKDAAKWVSDMQSVPELEQRGRMAANGLSEAQFELPEPIRKVLEAISSGNLDASQTSAIVTSVIDEEPAARGAIDSACKPGWTELVKELRALPPERRTERVASACKAALQVEAADQHKLMFASALLAIVVEKLLEQRGDLSDGERTLARFIAHVHRSGN